VFKSGDKVFHGERLFQLGQMAQMVCVGVKEFTKFHHKMCPSKIPLTSIFTPLPPLLTFKIQIDDTLTNFSQLISDSMQGEVMFHLSDPTNGIQAINFVHLDSEKTQFVMKVMGVRAMEKGRFGIFMI
jgi:hypothetical protein